MAMTAAMSSGSKFLAARHPSNNAAVQRILLRAAYMQDVDAFTFRSMLAAAHTLAHLTQPASHVPLNALRNTPTTGRQAKRLAGGHGGVLQPAVLPGVGPGVCRIVGEATVSTGAAHNGRDHATNTTNVRGDAHAQHAPHGGMGSRSLTYDEVEAVCCQVSAVLTNTFAGKVFVSTIGAHRRGAPYSALVDLLATHADVTRGTPGGLVTLAEKANRALEDYCTMKPRMDCTALSPTALPSTAGSHVTSLLRWRGRAGSGDAMVVPPLNDEEAVMSMELLHDTLAPNEEPSGDAAAPSLANSQEFTPPCRIRIRWTTIDRYAPQQLFLTGPETYVSTILEHAATARQLDVSIQGVRSIAGGGHPQFTSTAQLPADAAGDGGGVGAWQQIPSELSLYAALRLPYAHPFNRW